jgi:cytochrome c oxidase subunit 2
MLLGTVVMLASSIAMADQLNMTEGVTPISKDIHSLHMIILWIVTIAGILVFAVMIYSLINHRKSRGAVAEQFHENTTLEVIWTAIPFVILVMMAIPATKLLIEYEDPSNADITIMATGYQWKWKYDYIDDKVSFFSALDARSNEIRQVKSGLNPAEHNDADGINTYLLDVDNPIVVPVNKKVRILTTANDVIHSWWVPKLGIKRDAIPGYVNESHFTPTETGTYRGQCTELCGKDHGFMPIVVNVVEEKEYVAWLSEKKGAAAAAAAASGKTFSMDELMSKGEAAYNTNCASCHQPTGEGLPGVFPAMKGSKIATGPVADHLDIVIHGSKKNPAMAAFGGQLDDVTLAAIITYERNAWGNNTGDVVQPADIKAAR